jgi:N-acetylmuramoyl-L-alanine amidase
VKLNWLLPGIIGSLLAALATLPAAASEIVSWRFDQTNNRLDFATDSRVKPEAQLLADPSKLVISLPETKLNRSTQRQPIGKGVRELRVGYNEETRTTNLVFELESGYVFDPRQILIRANSANQWSVQLPEAQLAKGGAMPTGNVSVFNETGALVAPDRQVVTSVVTGASSSPPPASSATLVAASGSPATISAVEVDKQYNRVIIRGSRQLTYSGSWDAKGSVYRVVIPNARLAGNFKFPSQNEVNLQIFSAGPNSVNVEVRRFDRNQIGPVVQYYAGQILSLPYGVAPRPVVAETRPSTSTPRTTTPTPTTIPSSGRPVNRQVLVMIDPGHGGRDPGAIGLGGLKEVDVIWPIAKRVSKILESQGIRTKLTRDGDYYVGLDERVTMTNRNNATVFVSIHANSIDGRPDVNGLETYFYGPAGGRMAEAVHRNVLSSVTQKGFYIGNRGTRSARFLVLRKSQVPAILVETGYLTSAAEVARLRRDDYQAVQAEGIAKGIIEYLRQQ